MAQEKVIEIKTGEAIKNISDLKNNITELKKQLSTLDIGSKEYQTTLVSLQENQAALRNAMYGTSASLKDVMAAATGANVVFDDNNELVQAETVSYNELVRQLAVLKQQWRATTDEQERADLGEKIDSVNTRLKEMDASVGVFGRNVGNYTGALDQFAQGFGAMGRGAQSIINPLKGVTGGMKALSATPVIAILGVLANLLMKVSETLKTSEGNTKGLATAMAPLAAIGDAITKVFQGLGRAVVWVVEQFGKLTTAILGNNEAAEERIKLAEQEQALVERQRETLVQNAKDERDIAELRAKATEKNKYTAAERLAFLEEAGRREKEIAERERENARQAYENLKLRTSLTETSKEEMDALAQAEANMIKAETDYYQRIRRINSGIVEARNQEIVFARNAAKAVKDAALAKIAAEKDYLAELLAVTKAGTDEQLTLQNQIAAMERDKAKADATAKIQDREALGKALALIDKKYALAIEQNQEAHDKAVLDEQLQAIANRRDALQKGSVEYAMVQEEYARAAYDGLTQQLNESDAAFEARRLAAMRSLKESQHATMDAVAKETQNALKAEQEALVQGSVESLAVAVEMAKENLASLYQGIDESTDAYNARRLEAARAVAQAEDALMQAGVERETTIMHNRVALLEEGSLEYLAAAMEIKKFELDTLHQLEGESEEQFRARQLAAEKAYIDAKKALWQKGLAMFQSVASATSGLLGSIADMYENDTNATEAEQKKAKNLRVAGATIDMLSGVVSAISTAQQLGPITGPIMAAINSAAVIAAGTANINKIKSQQVSKNGTSTAAPTAPLSVPAPTITPQVQEVRTLTGASEEERLNQPQRVYILASDLEAERNASRVQVAETTF